MYHNKHDSSTFYDMNKHIDDFLHLVRSGNCTYCVLEHIANGFDINKQEIDYYHWLWPPLVYSIKENNEKMIELLLTNGADVNLQSKYRTSYRTALEDACEKGLTNIVKILVKAGAGIYSAFERAIHSSNRFKHQNIEIINMLLSTETLQVELIDKPIFFQHENDIFGGKIRTPIVCAYLHEQCDLINLLLEMGANLRNFKRELITSKYLSHPNKAIKYFYLKCKYQPVTLHKLSARIIIKMTKSTNARQLLPLPKAIKMRLG